MNQEPELSRALPALPKRGVVLFAMGQFGIAIASYAVSNLLLYFYAPPVVDGQSLFPLYLYGGAVVGVLPLIGLISMVAYLLGALVNPLVATWSDTSRARLGRRRSFMAISAIPFALCSVLVFLPPEGPFEVMRSFRDGWHNTFWLAASIVAYFFFSVMYATPYAALFSELGHNTRERLNLSTAMSIAWALGFLCGTSVFVLKDALSASFGLSPVAAFQWVVALFGILGAVFMLAPVLFINERRYAEANVSGEWVFKALANTLKDKHFLTFIGAELCYFMCLAIMQSGLVFFVSALLGLSDKVVSSMMVLLFVLSFACYPLVNLIAKRTGKRRLMLWGFLVFLGDFILICLMGILPLPALFYAYLVMAIAALPVAIFGILPNAIVADIARAAGRRTGTHKAGIYFGMRTFEMNLGIALANALFPSLKILGQTVENPTGVRLATLVAAGLCLLGMLVFSRYREKQVLEEPGADSIQ